MNPENEKIESTTPSSGKSGKGAGSVFRRLDNLGSLGLNALFSHYGLLVLVLVLGVLHIYNSHMAEYYVRETAKREQEVQQLRWYYMTTFAQYTRQTKQSEVEKKISSRGLKPLVQPPYKLESKP